MEHTLRGTVMQSVEIKLEQGESVFTEAGGMAWMTANIDMASGMKGGLMAGLGRALSGESLFMTDYTCNSGSGSITFTTETPGKIMIMQLEAGQMIVCQRDAFMVAQEGVTLEMHFQKKIGAGLFGGEGFFMQKITGPGLACMELSGEIVEYNLEAGQVLKVDPGHVAMMDATVDFDITMVKGIRNMIMGGEGLFLATVSGPGRVWLQSMPISNLARKIATKLPASRK